MRVTIDTDILDSIGNAIRHENGETSKYHPQNMANKILTLPKPVYDKFDSSVSSTISGWLGNYYVKDGNTFDTSTITGSSIDSLCMNWSMKYIPKIITNSTKTDLTNLYRNASKVTSIDISGIDFSSVTTIGGMFRGCTSLQTIDFTGCNIENVNEFSGAFREDNNLTTITGGNDVNATQLSYMCYGCTNLTTFNLNLKGTPTAIANTFGQCTNLENLDLHNLDFSSITGADVSNNVSTFFSSSNNLKNLVFPKNLGVGYSASLTANVSTATITLNNATQLTHDSLMSIINSVADLTGKNQQTINLGATNLAKLSVDEIAIATDKNWRVI